ncbi:thiamine phosphate synthase [Flavobacterium psychrophilum]|uniref:Thiamine-phosphate synthase n=2 Tax=Flavobacterium psychrophilum TaxID=96345 RepID=A0A7U2U983_FLAPS|nr:thiamine phosphate synthase [Flavobacterium psychrophilum]EKT3957773.1 thiamine phosphate synthase [Flavobacterium psychrophilum]EKT3962915.1 thiamine phosphate synthase [Flavobacterium psychrophilum]EKT4510527.1 thiamine phosphate synthase [Flavobacterium psychrophilum]EKT4549260.1 thiamine phosphate synthase [Flavobacterium psychrophilum]ELI6454388.1 thiamine phosphate synthase [Flavobacterium psychrophilum]
MYNKLQYISQGKTIEEQLLNIRKALENGCQWIQMRFKDTHSDNVFTLAEAVKRMCQEYTATFIINDNVYLAKKINADGVHLGLNDMNIAEARTILGEAKIIGGTANTFEEVLQRTAENCNYIGLGPFQFTATKEKLSPVLGLEGYHLIIQQMKTKKNKIPIYAIGGIQLENVDDIMKTGIYGIAVSGLITQSENPFQIITQLNKKL